jgi:hypothetical protein
MVVPPKLCPNGHQLGPGKMLVGHQPCAGYCGSGHTTWSRNECGESIYHPPTAAGCRLLDATAFKR